MRPSRPVLVARIAFLSLASILTASTSVLAVVRLAVRPLSAMASVYRVMPIYAFKGTPDGSDPDEGVVASTTGDLYGVTGHGGAKNFGTVYKLVRSGSSYKESVIYSFQGATDGQTPSGTLLLRSGAVFGTTQAGGASSNGCGTVFKLTPHGATYVEQVIFRFKCFSAAGTQPSSGVIADAAGNLYGTTAAGGNNSQGIVFSLVRSGTNYSETILHSFLGGDDGAGPSGLVFGPDGALYGTTAGGGGADRGTVFKVVKAGKKYQETILYTFRGTKDGANPVVGLTVDLTGALYGTTSSGGPGNGGTVFRLTPTASGFQEQTLHSFGPPNEANLRAGVLRDGAGNLFGTAGFGGSTGSGAAYELSPHGSVYRIRIIYNFQGSDDGADPTGTLIEDSSGALYGTTTLVSGSTNGGVYKLSP